MTILILYFLLVLLLLGCYTDLKYRYVSPLITYPFFVIGIMQAILSSVITHLDFFKIGIFAFFFVAYLLESTYLKQLGKQIGSADIIILAPILLLVGNPLLFIITLDVVWLITFFIFKTETPLFLAITAGFLMAIG